MQGNPSAPPHQLELTLDAPPSGRSKRTVERAGRSPRRPVPGGPAVRDDLTERARQLAIDLGLRRLGRWVEVHWNGRLQTSAGRAVWGKSIARIELNPQLDALPEAQREAEIERTFVHELAHLVAYARAGRRRIKPHGPEWRQACADLGIPGESACHTLGLRPSRRHRRRYGYQCPQCHEVLKRVRQIKGPAACYTCCKDRAKGRFDARFALVEFRM